MIVFRSMPSEISNLCNSQASFPPRRPVRYTPFPDASSISCMVRYSFRCAVGPCFLRESFVKERIANASRRCSRWFLSKRSQANPVATYVPLPSSLQSVRILSSNSQGRRWTPVAAMASAAHVSMPVKLFGSGTVGEAFAQTVLMLVATGIAVIYGNRMLYSVCNKIVTWLGKRSEGKEGGDSTVTRIFKLALESLEMPVQVLLPWLGAMFGLAICATFGEVALVKWGAATGLSTMGRDSMLFLYGKRVVKFLGEATYWVTDLSEIIFIVMVTWWFIRFKDNLVSVVLEGLSLKPGVTYNVSRVVRSLNSLLSGVTYAMAAIAVSAALGYDIKAIVTLGSASTVALGFAAQSTVANVVAGLSLYASQAFGVGDRVALKAMKDGATILEGTIQEITPFVTIIRTDAGTPTFLQNRDMLSSVLVVNASQHQTGFGSAPQNPSLAPLDTKFSVRYCDIDAILPIINDITRWMEQNPLVYLGNGGGCTLDGFGNKGPVLRIKCALRSGGDTSGENEIEANNVAAQVLLQADRIVRQHGAFLAVDKDVPLPASLASAS